MNRFQHNESLKSFGSLENYVIFSKDFEELLMQGQSMSSISCFWQIERMELIQGRGCSSVLAKTSLCQFWSHSTCRRAPFLIWGPLWTELPPTALKELSLPFEFKICILWIKTCYISICYIIYNFSFITIWYCIFSNKAWIHFYIENYTFWLGVRLCFSFSVIITKRNSHGKVVVASSLVLHILFKISPPELQVISDKNHI